MGFNPRTHGGCDSETPRPQGRHGVSIHAPTGGATIRFPIPRISCTFQSTHPRGVRQNTKNMKLQGRVFQSTHPRGVRRDDTFFLQFLIQVSIHAPTGGATKNIISKLSLHQSFNPRTHGGCDESVKRAKRNSVVSIHAPTGGATLSSRRVHREEVVSIHAPTGGATFVWMQLT